MSWVADKEISQVHDYCFGVPSLLPPPVFWNISSVCVLVWFRRMMTSIYIQERTSLVLVPLLSASLSFVQEVHGREENLPMQKCEIRSHPHSIVMSSHAPFSSESLWFASYKLGNHAGIHSPFWTIYVFLQATTDLLYIGTFAEHDLQGWQASSYSPHQPDLQLFCGSHYKFVFPTGRGHDIDLITCIDSNLLHIEIRQKECVTRVSWFKEICSESIKDMYLITLQFNQGMIIFLSLSNGILHICLSLTVMSTKKKFKYSHRWRWTHCAVK